MQKGDKEFNVDVSCVGCSGFTFKLKSDNCKKILVNLAVSGSFIEDGTQQEYKIKRRGINKKVLNFVWKPLEQEVLEAGILGSGNTW